MVFIENEGALFRGPSRSHPAEVYHGANRGWEPYPDAGKSKPIEWGNEMTPEEASELMREIDRHRGQGSR